MIRFFKKIFSKETSSSEMPVGIVEPPDLDFDALRNSFYKRSYDFEYYRNKYLKQNPRLLHWIGSIDYSGYTREASLNFLIDNYESGDENRILLRLEDWVEPIRKIAESWTTDHFHNLSLSQLNDNYRLLLYLSRKQKLQHSPVLQTINRCLVNHVSTVSRSEFMSLHSMFRRYLYGLTLPGNTVIRQWLLEDRDPFNRLLIFTIYPYEELTQKEAQSLQVDSSVMIRKRLLMEQVKRGIQPPQTLLKSYCFDKNAGIRIFARYYIKKYYNIDAYDLYLEQENTTFFYLADFGNPEDKDVFLEGIKNTDKQIKLLCLKTLCKIDPSSLLDLNVESLIQENSKLRKIVCSSLPKVVSIDKILHLKTILQEIQPSGMVIFLQMVYRKSFWVFINEALTVLLENPSNELVQLIRHIFYNTTAIYEQLPENLSISIQAKIDKMVHDNNPAIPQLMADINFLVNHHISKRS